MKSLIGLFFLWCFMGQALANNACVKCETTLEGAPWGDKFDWMGKFTNHMINETDRKNLANLGGSICQTFNKSETPTKVKSRISTYMQDHLGMVSPTNKDIINFINKHRNYMTCSGDKYKNKDFIQASFMHSSAYRQLFDDLFFEDLRDKNKGYSLDFNAVTFTATGGKPETVLDYVTRVYEDALKRLGKDDDFVKGVKRVKRMLEKKYKAKHFHQLPLAYQHKFKRLATGSRYEQPH